MKYRLVTESGLIKGWFADYKSAEAAAIQFNSAGKEQVRILAEKDDTPNLQFLSEINGGYL